ncbi:putative secretion ATPase (PEP-CTERM system associated) [Sphingobium sp. OAS761]|uniref:XrtA/PEP-CTERM system-associated ATPase n=1 Tax=Sphingobium sp. OAS761 TaxID=2817901 RepID=UPI00209F71CA|nr:XrtA/PEP-CTERM system-associated ATPase [Sphingobium sp. OAS761]MCP1470847.1 putative secretion ATPase (PEP-CTERM system associated) [Sphingobium sp. OAS761]
MYDQFYGLQGRPFQLTPDPHYYFESATHRKALSYLGYGLAQGEGFIVITGDIGAGKTTLVGHLMQTIDPSRLTAVKIVTTQVGGDDMLRMAAQSFGLASEGMTKAATLHAIESFLHAQARAGRRTLLIVDEAQNLPVQAIEELRMLSNFQLGGQSLLQIFLLGQPEFRDLVKSPELEQLRQRVIATHHLEPMMAHEIEPYVLHRLGVAGWQGDPRFTAAAFAALYAATDGVPRRLNAVVSRVLLMGAIEQLHEIDADVVIAVVADMGLDADLTPEPVAPSALDAIDAVDAAEPNTAAESEPEAEQPLVAQAEPTWDEAECDDADDLPGDDDDIVEEGLAVEEWERAAEPEITATDEPAVPAAFSDDVLAGDTQEDQDGQSADEDRWLRVTPPAIDPAPFAAPFAGPTGRDEAGAEEEIESFADWDIDPVVDEESPISVVAQTTHDVGDDRVPDQSVDALRADMMDEIAALRAEISSLRAMQAHPHFAPADTVDPEVLKSCFTLIEERLVALEFRAEEQDTALRRVLTLLVEWVEREDRMSEGARGAAAA